MRKEKIKLDHRAARSLHGVEVDRRSLGNPLDPYIGKKYDKTHQFPGIYRNFCSCQSYNTCYELEFETDIAHQILKHLLEGFWPTNLQPVTLSKRFGTLEFSNRQNGSKDSCSGIYFDQLESQSRNFCSAIFVASRLQKPFTCPNRSAYTNLKIPPICCPNFTNIFALTISGILLEVMKNEW